MVFVHTRYKGAREGERERDRQTERERERERERESVRDEEETIRGGGTNRGTHASHDIDGDGAHTDASRD